MKRMIKYPSIGQFRNIVKNVIEHSCFIGLDSEGVAQFDYLKPKPTYTFNATEKIHGTNAGVCFSNIAGIWFQSRENIITPEKDNMGFAFFGNANKDILINIIQDLAKENNINLYHNIITIYGEWAGGKIQKNSALTNCEKTFIMFEYFKVSPIEPNEDIPAKWFRMSTIEYPSARIYNILRFNNYNFTIDFNTPELIQNDLIKLVEEVIEPASPLGKAFGQEENVGEGIVCSYLTEDGELLQFKVKGEKHSTHSKVKTLQQLDMAELNKLEECVEKVCHTWRFEQALVSTFGEDYASNLDRKLLGDYLKWVSSDTLKEEYDIILEYGFEPKDVLGKVAKKAKEYFFEVEQDRI